MWTNLCYIHKLEVVNSFQGESSKMKILKIGSAGAGEAKFSKS